MGNIVEMPVGRPGRHHFELLLVNPEGNSDRVDLNPGVFRQLGLGLRPLRVDVGRSVGYEKQKSANFRSCAVLLDEHPGTGCLQRTCKGRL